MTRLFMFLSHLYVAFASDVCQEEGRCNDTRGTAMLQVATELGPRRSTARSIGVTAVQEVHGLKLTLRSDRTDAAISIPKIIHHTSKVQIDLANTTYITAVSWKSWRKLFPSPEYRTITALDDDLERCVTQEFPNFTSQWAKLQGVEKADAGRYCMLYKHGGIYADLDYEVRTNFFEELNANGAQVHLIEACYQESPDAAAVQVQNALMASPPKHSFWKRVFESMQLGGNSHEWNSVHGTGPRMLSNLASEHLPDVHLLPCANFQRVGRCGDFRQLEFQKGIHWNQASWIPGSDHSWNKDLIHKGFENAHPDLGDVGLQNTQAALRDRVMLFKLVHGESDPLKMRFVLADQVA